MRRVSVLLTIFAIAFVLVVSNTNANDFKIGSTVENFKLFNLDNEEKSFNDLKGEKGTIVVFLSAQCPVVKQYDDRLNKVVADFQAKGINTIGINSNVTEYSADKFDWMKSHHVENYKFPVLIDKDNIIADKWGATATPEIYFFDKDGKLAYHGAIDNDQSGRNIKMFYLEDALNQYLGGESVKVTRIKAIGCTIKRVKAA